MSEDDKPSVKAKLPSAREISRRDFTPHGIKSKGGSKPSGLTAAEAQKRRRIAIIVGVVAVLAIAGTTTYFVTRPGPEVKVSGAFGKEPKVSIPSDLKPGKKLVTKELIKGTGKSLGKDDTAYFKFSAYDWTDKSSKKLTGFTYDQAQNLPMTTPAAQAQQGGTVPLLATLQKNLKGAKIGSRYLLEIPPGNGYGDQGNTQVGVNPTDSMVWVMDIMAKSVANESASGTAQPLNDPKLPAVKDNGPNKAPTITIPKVDPPAATTAKVLIQGNGPAVTKGQNVVVQYTGEIWGTSAVFDSTWQKGGSPQLFPKIGEGGLVPGMDNNLVGQKVGSRILLTIIPADGYGKQGNPQAQIKGTDTLVFVVDVISAF